MRALALPLALLALPAWAEPTTIAEASFPEGPTVLSDGRLLFAQYAGNLVSSWDGTSVANDWDLPGCGPSAVVPFKDGLLVTCYDDGTLAFLGADPSEVSRIAADAEGQPLVGPNDIAPAGSSGEDGGLFVTASGPWESAPIVGRVYHLASDGVLRVVADDLHYANGVSMGPDGRLYVAESEAGRVISFAVAGDGSLSDRRLFARIAVADPDSGIGAYPDGIEWGPDGNLWVGQYSSGRIVVLAPDGSLAAVHDTVAAAAPNLAFSPDGRTAYVAVVDDTSGPPYAGRMLALPLE